MPHINVNTTKIPAYMTAETARYCLEQSRLRRAHEMRKRAVRAAGIEMRERAADRRIFHTTTTDMLEFEERRFNKERRFTAVDVRL